MDRQRIRAVAAAVPLALWCGAVAVVTTGPLLWRRARWFRLAVMVCAGAWFVVLFLPRPASGPVGTYNAAGSSQTPPLFAPPSGVLARGSGASQGSVAAPAARPIPKLVAKVPLDGAAVVSSPPAQSLVTVAPGNPGDGMIHPRAGRELPE